METGRNGGEDGHHRQRIAINDRETAGEAKKESAYLPGGTGVCGSFTTRPCTVHSTRLRKPGAVWRETPRHPGRPARRGGGGRIRSTSGNVFAKAVKKRTNIMLRDLCFMLFLGNQTPKLVYNPCEPEKGRLIPETGAWLEVKTM